MPDGSRSVSARDHGETTVRRWRPGRRSPILPPARQRAPLLVSCACWNLGVGVARSAASISAVIPAYNEERIIASTVEALDETLARLVDDYEIIVVNDGSHDATPQIVEGLSQERPAVRLVSHAVNRGYGATLATGFAAATRDYVFLTDGDRQFDVHELEGFLPRLSGADVVVGFRRPRADPLVRRFYGWGWNLLVNTLFGYTARDVDCAFKLFPRRLLQDVRLVSTGHTLSPELLIKARRAGFRVAEVRVTHLPRTAGQAKGARLDHIIRSLVELARLRLDLVSQPVQPASRERAARP
ncbi:MAG: glycosyltransferase family 2 protein [Chloroflexi bacterium]|nr:glycosyltransferase family 2 protein [Chloroflexota bacterium]